MDIWIVMLLFGAGLVGGAVNAIAGGATLITFPAMLAAGLPPIAAAASNAVAVSPGHAFGAAADRQSLPPADRAFRTAVRFAIAGGAIGAVLLLVTPERLFTLLVPPLLALSTLIFAFGRKAQALIAARSSGCQRDLRNGLLFGASIYGGYFGAGLGVMLLAVLTLTGNEDLRRANALKNLLATAVSGASIAIFALQGAVRWPQTLVMLAGAVLGGLIGGRLNAILPTAAVRSAIVVIGVAMTGVYAWRYWLQ